MADGSPPPSAAAIAPASSVAMAPPAANPGGLANVTTGTRRSEASRVATRWPTRRPRLGAWRLPAATKLSPLGSPWVEARPGGWRNEASLAPHVADDGAWGQPWPLAPHVAGGGVRGQPWPAAAGSTSYVFQYFTSARGDWCACLLQQNKRSIRCTSRTAFRNICFLVTLAEPNLARQTQETPLPKLRNTHPDATPSCILPVCTCVPVHIYLCVG